MHEMSLCLSLLSIIGEEMGKRGLTRLIRVRVKHGALANVVPEALETAFRLQTADTAMEGALLELVEEPLRLACGSCSREFSPEVSSLASLSPCPHCGENFGHSILAGKELYLEQLEME